MGQMYDAQKITSDFFETHPAGGQTTPAETRSWARTHIRPDHKPLLNALRFLYADAWVLGEKNALAQYGYAVGFKKADAPNPKDIAQAMAIDWKEWEPGNAAAAALLSPPSGLQSILDSRMTTISSIDQTSYDRLGTKLADALNQGLSKEDTASLISDVITDPARANMIAVTESARATCVASRDMYESSGVEYVEWLVAEGCEDCQQNRDAGPIPIDATFPSGDSEPPAHPNCMCDLAPYVVDTQNTGGGDALDASFTPVDDGGDSGDSGAAAATPAEIISEAGLQPLMPYKWEPTPKFDKSIFDTEKQYLTAKESITKAADSPLAIRMSGDTLKKVIKDGRMKTVEEVQSNFRDTISDRYRNARQELENGQWKVPKETIQPIYGYMDVPKDLAGSADLSFYGDAKIILKDSVKERTTLSAGDTLNNKLVPLLVKDVQAGNVDPVSLSGAVSPYAVSLNKITNIEYWEAQIHGGVKLSDIAAVEVRWYASYSNVVREDLIKQLTDLGIEVRQ